MGHKEDAACQKLLDAFADLWNGDDEVLCRCGHDVEDHNDIWKRSTECHRCECKEWEP